MERNTSGKTTRQKVGLILMGLSVLLFIALVYFFGINFIFNIYGLGIFLMFLLFFAILLAYQMR